MAQRDDRIVPCGETTITNSRVNDKDLSSSPLSYEHTEPEPVSYRLATHVKRQTSRIVDADPPPSNHHRGTQRIINGGGNRQSGDGNANRPLGNGSGGGNRQSDNGNAKHPLGNGSGGGNRQSDNGNAKHPLGNGSGGGNRQSGDGNTNHLLGNGSGGDGSGGHRGGGYTNVGHIGSIPARQNGPSKWRWSCGACHFQNLSYNYDTSCPSCGHHRDHDCPVWGTD